MQRECWFLVLLLFGSAFGQFVPDGANLKITAPGQAIVAVKNSGLDMRICRAAHEEKKKINLCYGADENGSSQGICGNCLIRFTFHSGDTKQYISVTGSNGEETETTQNCLDVELKTNGFTAMGKFYSCTASLVYGNALAVVLKDQLPSFATITLLNTEIAKPQPGSAEILPWWAWLLIAIACLIAVAAGVFFVFVLCKPKEKKKKKKKIPTTVETPEEAARQREAFERAIRKNAEKARMPDLPKNLDKRKKFIYGCVTVEAMMFPYWQIKDRLLKRYPPPNEKEYEWNTETILEWFVYFNPLDAYPEEVVEDMPTPDSITRIQDLYHENDLEKAIDAVEVELFSCGPNELVYKFGKLWQDCMETCLKWGMKKREDGTYQLNKNIKERVVKNEGTGRQYRTFMFVQEYINLFTSPKFPKKYDKWPISALYANMFRLDYYPKLVIFMMFSIKVKYLMAVAPYYSADTQNQMAHPIPALRMALENDKERFMESLLQLKHAMVKFNDKTDSFSEKMSNMIKVLTPKD